MKTEDLCPAQRKAAKAIKRHITAHPGVSAGELADIVSREVSCGHTSVEMAIRALNNEGFLVSRRVRAGGSRVLTLYYRRGQLDEREDDVCRIFIDARKAPKYEGPRFESAFHQTVHWLAIANKGGHVKQVHSNSTLLTAFGRTQCLTEWAREFGMDHRTLQTRIKRGQLTIEEALTMPVIHKYSRKASRHV